MSYNKRKSRGLKAAVWRLINRLGYEIREARQRPPVTYHTLKRILYFQRMVDRVHDEQGAIVECGAGRGDSLLYLSYLTDGERNVWGFDSFEGFPEPSPQDASPRNPHKGEWGAVRYEGVMEMFQASGLSQDFLQRHFHLIKGFVDQSLARYDGGPIALLHLDVDLYQSYKDCLQALYHLVVPGGLILFDEYNEPAFPGATMAIDEFLADKPEALEQDESGKHFVVKR